MGITKIEWADRTWNPLTGCTKVSPGCDHCYAKTMHERFNGPGSFDTITLHPDRLTQPSRWRKPSRVFVNSMSNLFHKDVPDEFIAAVFAMMAASRRHTFQVLTKRPVRMRSLLSSPAFTERVCLEYHRRKWGLPKHANVSAWLGMPLPNVWLGVSVENQKWADIRTPALLETPAAVRFLSCEPLLGPIDLDNCGGYQAVVTPADLAFSRRLGDPDQPHVDWVIVGGESGPGARPMQLDWARALRDQCTFTGAAFLFKQWGEWEPRGLHVGSITDPRECVGEVVDDGKYPALEWRRMYYRVGKKAAGRELDGRTWDECPGGVA
jgi:protein gp37